MLIAPPAPSRQLRLRTLAADLVVVGGGLAGVCAALTAARTGIRVILVQDRPVLGGNASSEVRLWVLGATSHLGNNNRWSREGGVIDELLVENLYRNPEGNPLIFDALLLEKTLAEPNLTLLLNTAVNEVFKDSEAIAAVRGFNAQDSTTYELRAPLFCDASGDGVVGFLAGAAFRMGAEAAGEFNEGLAPTTEYGELLGHTIYFYSKDAGRPVHYTPPAFALTDITAIPRWRNIKAKDFGCRFWWFEYGGRHDTVHDTEQIKYELWKIVYGVWDHIKNSGQFPEAANMTLEWVGTVPGKRESRRFEGPGILTQHDVVNQTRFPDVVAYGGWSLDLHPADGVYSTRPGCNQYHARGTYDIPYRCLYSRNVPNLFLAGRIISVSHVAFSSTRVMATCAYAAQAVGVAAALCARQGLQPGDLAAPERMAHLQLELMRRGQHLPGQRLNDADDLVRRATITASSTFRLATLASDGQTLPLDVARAMLLPVAAGTMPTVAFWVDVTQAGDLVVELRTSDRPDNHTPDRILAGRKLTLAIGNRQEVIIDLPVTIDQPRYVFVCLHRAPGMAVHTSATRVTGVLSVARKGDAAVSTTGAQVAPPGSGVQSFEFWTPQRRPEGRNLACTVTPALDLFAPTNITDGIDRPTNAPHAWVADPDDAQPHLILTWEKPQTISRIELAFDADFDHPVESVLMGHPERTMPFTVRNWRLRDDQGNLLATVEDQHLTLATVRLTTPISTTRLILECLATNGAPAAVFAVRAYA
jgi:FAD dependent oxidoreductase